jgi:hypothetical protein
VHSHRSIFKTPIKYISDSKSFSWDALQQLCVQMDSIQVHRAYTKMLVDLRPCYSDLGGTLIATDDRRACLELKSQSVWIRITRIGRQCLGSVDDD